MKTKFQHQQTTTGPQPSRAKVLSDHYIGTFAGQDARVSAKPSEANIRERAYVLYVKANRCDGHDIEQWVEATSQLKAEALGSWSCARNPQQSMLPRKISNRFLKFPR